MSVEKLFRIGVDVGGTNTDSVVLHPGQAREPQRGVLGAFKTPTTQDVTHGIVRAIEGALYQSAIAREAVSAVMIGTTHFINSVVQADDLNLRKVALLRICGPYTKENPAFLDFPPILARIMNGHVAYLDGGLEFDTRDIMPLNEDQIRSECQTIREKGITDVAIAGIFSPLDIEGRQEERVKEIILQEIQGADVVLSREIGNLGFLERENATILNTSILKFARKTIQGFKAAMKALGLTCPLYLTQNDGTIIDAGTAQKYPIKTFSSGPTNSMSGAAYLAGLDTASGQISDSQVIVADIGGTTTDVCALLPSGFPRQAGTWVEIGGVRSSFPMPEVLSVGLGGGTIVAEHDGKVIVGPESVGHRLLKESLIFGGKTMTTTDIVVASGKENIGDSDKVQNISSKTITQARLSMKRILENAVDAMKLNADDAIIILVGGGSIVAIDDLDGVKKMIRPQFHDCANAVGAAIAKVSGHIDTVKVLEGLDEDRVIDEISRDAKQKAIEAGAHPDSVRIISLNSLPLQYVQMKANRIIVTAAGSLSEESLLADIDAKIDVESSDEAVDETLSASKRISNSEKHSKDFIVSPSALISVRDYRPEVDGSGVWWVSEIDCEFLATGCSVLACGGGGPGYMCYMAARAAIKAGKRLPVVDIETLPEDEYILGSVSYGAPTVTLERIPSGTESKDATDALLGSYPGLKMAAQAAIEIGGMNGIRPLLTAIDYSVPTVDGDFMGRAYPRLYMLTPWLFGLSATPCTQSDGNGNVVTVNKAADMHKLEKIHRKAGHELGLFSQLVIPPITVKDTKKVGTLGTTSLAWYIGKAVYQARQEKTSIMDAIVNANPSGRILYTGKIVSVHRYISTGGYTEGRVRLKPISSDEQEYGESSISEKRDMVLPFQNEYIYAELVDPDEKEGTRGKILCTVPDLISLIGTDGYALGTQDLRYGVRVSVVAFVAHPHWYTSQGLACGGPKEFGYTDLDFVPLGNPYYEPKRVTKEFRPKLAN
ncbi:putative n-methylhydantoinase a acetone beta subunit [Phaeomoniella chlamydospora]|uniref:Putative n-methylhydantoinase a acetone beta subunit n=1 Tax=Phaeomoniella chlamydospora TaxID=158046 RepID=A0A0G2ENU8_PHACM|nr:putative n-methylhydantoinase a acetone beta subunit [Phaeomoniella chlamydospora]